MASATRVGRKTKTSDQSHERKSQVLFCTLSTSCRSRSALKNQTFDLIATCAFGLEAVVRRELRELGIDSTIGESGRIHFRGDATIICQTNLWLRTADRILIRVSEFPAADFDSLFEVTKQITWGDLLPEEGRLHEGIGVGDHRLELRVEVRLQQQRVEPRTRLRSD